MTSNFVKEHAWTGDIAPLLEVLFSYIDRLLFLETLYVTGRPPISKKLCSKVSY